MPISPTHIATDKRTGEKVLVEYDEKTNEYKENGMICLSDQETRWELVEIIEGDKE